MKYNSQYRWKTFMVYTEVMNKKNIIKKVILVIIIIIITMIGIKAFKVWNNLNLKSINNSSYYKSKFGDIYIALGSSCFIDFCTPTDFKKLDIDKKTFKILEFNSKNTYKSEYAKDKNKVFYKGQEIIGADSSTFKVLDALYSKDKNQVFFEGKGMVGSNSSNFEKIDSSGDYTKDKNQVFYRGKEIVGADLLTFKLLDGLYSKDKNHVFYQEKNINSDPQTFLVFGHFGCIYAKDKNQVFKGEKKINFDAQTFAILDSDCRYTKDKDNVFYLGRKINADAPTFVVLDSEGVYAKDKDQVLCLGEKITSADAPTFKELDSENSIAKDVNQYYYYSISLNEVLSKYLEQPISKPIKLKSYSNNNHSNNDSFILETNSKFYLIDLSESYDPKVKEVDGQMKLENVINEY